MAGFIIISLIVTLITSGHGAILPKAGCSISVNTHLSDPQPLLLLQNKAVHAIEAFPLPVDRRGTLTFDQGDAIDIACPGSVVRISGSSTGKNVVEATCSTGITFVVEGKSVPFTALTCTTDAEHSARYTGATCATNKREIEIGFNVNNRFIRHITSCFDDDLQTVVYTRLNLTSAIRGFQSGYPRPEFEEGDFYNVSPDTVNYFYTRNRQRRTINTILGLSKSDTSIIQATSDYYLARGHNVAKADFVYGTQQRTTFYYVNAAPQWQIFNDGNWNTLEGDTRNLASNRGLDLVVYTGVYGVTTLPNTSGVQQKLYLYVPSSSTRGIPVPALFYKVVYDPASQAGIALLGINNPYKTVTSADIICTDVCNKVTWLTWNKTNTSLGYSYCCEVADFRKTVTVLPQFEVKSLLV